MKVRTRPLLLAAALLVGTAVPLTAPAAADTAPVPLGLSTLGRIVVDEAHGRVYASGGPSGPGVKVTDLAGAAVTTLQFEGATGMALSPDGEVLWLAQPSMGLVGIDTTTLVPTQRWPLPSDQCAGDVAAVGTRLVYGYSCYRYSSTAGSRGGIGVLDAGTGASYGTVTTGPSYQPTLAAGPAGQVYAADAGLSPASLYLYDVSGLSPALVAARAEVCGNLRDLAASPDGTRAVTSCGSPYRHDVWSSDKLEPAGSYPTGAYPLAGAWSADGSTFAAGTDSAYDADVHVFPAGATAPTRVHDFGTTSALLHARGLALSADGRRAWAVTSTGTDTLALRVLDTSAATPPPSVTPSSLALAADPPDVTVGFGTTVGGWLSSGGHGVAGATLSVTRALPGEHGSALPSVTTGLDGTFSFEDTPPASGTYTYTVAWAGDTTRSGVQASTDVLVRESTSTTMHLDLALGSAAGSVTGTLQLSSPDPAAVAGRSIALSRVSGTSTTDLPWVTTDDTGRASFSDTPGAGTHAYLAQLLASPSNGTLESTTSAQITVPGSTALSVVPSATSTSAGLPLTLRGTLSSAGAGVGGASVVVVRSGCGSAWQAGVTTGSDGSWSATDPAAATGTCTYSASYAGGAAYAGSSASTSVAVALRSTELTLSVVRGTGATKKHAYVTAHLGGWHTNRDVTLTAQPKGGAEVVIASGPVGEDGTLTGVYTPRSTTTYRARYAGDDWYAAATASRTQ